MTRVLVTGGTGGLGREVVPQLIEAGFTVRIISRRPRPASLLPHTEWTQADLETGQGISEAVSDIEVIVHSLLELFLRALTRVPLVTLLPTDLKFQPIATSEVAGRLREIATAGPGGRLPDIGGPQVHTFGELAHTWLNIRGMHRAVIPLPLPGKVAQGFRHGYNTCPEYALGKITWTEWVRCKYQHP